MFMVVYKPAWSEETKAEIFKHIDNALEFIKTLEQMGYAYEYYIYTTDGFLCNKSAGRLI